MTENQILEELLRPLNENIQADGGFTSSEVASMMNCSDDKARRYIRQLLVDGKAEPDRVLRQNMAGVWQKVSGYRIVA